MIRLIIRKELLDNLLSLKFSLGMGICLLLIGLSCYVSMKDYENRLRDYQSAIQEFREKPDVITPRIYRKPEMLSIFSHGYERRLGNMVWISPSGEVPFRATGYTNSPLEEEYRSEFTSVDFAFVVQMVLSLLAIFLSYGAISGERLAGTLKLCLSNSISRSAMLAGKFIGGVLSLMIALTLSMFLGLLISLLSPLVVFSKEEWLRIGVMWLGSALYLSAFFMLGLLVSCRTDHPATALLVLLLIWTALLVILPNVSVVLVDRLIPIPSERQMQGRIAAVNESFHPQFESLLKKLPSLNREIHVKRTELHTRWGQAIWQVKREYLNRLYYQTEWVSWLNRLTLGGAYRSLMESLARTDLSAYRRFMEHTRRYHAEHRRLMKLLWTDRKRYDRERERFLQPFQPPSVTLSESVRAGMLDLILLFLFNVLFFMTAYLSFARHQFS
ncbi:ABC transporter permease subunit [Candidatus Poribacteria bacterium]|nr:ABC transporter permease subunit [Candidatus Poribacteria bacterium]